MRDRPGCLWSFAIFHPRLPLCRRRFLMPMPIYANLCQPMPAYASLCQPTPPGSIFHAFHRSQKHPFCTLRYSTVTYGNLLYTPPPLSFFYRKQNHERLFIAIFWFKAIQRFLDASFFYFYENTPNPARRFLATIPKTMLIKP